MIKKTSLEILYMIVVLILLIKFLRTPTFVRRVELNKSQALPLPALKSYLDVNDSYRCSLLFFGIPKMFKDIVLPSIERYILEPNPNCDVYMHTFNITSITNERNDEISNSIRIQESYGLTSNVWITPIDEFELSRNISHYRKYYYKKWGKCCTSVDNMIKQWHSIDKVWKLMMSRGDLRLNKEIKNISESLDSDASLNFEGGYYERVGLFRSDVVFTHPIVISNGAAVIPNFGQFKGENDRMFYGQFKHAKIWATKRFEYVDEYLLSESKNNTTVQIHSEKYLLSLLRRFSVPFVTKDICFWRARASGLLKTRDCVPPIRYTTNN